MTATIVEVDSLTLLDFDPQLPCESVHCKPEPKPATHRYTGTTWCGCRYDILLCTPHAAIVRSRLHEVLILLCEQCRSCITGRICDWLRLEPLP